MRVSVIVPPAANPDWPSMGAEVIAAASRRAGHDAAVHYAQLLQSRGESLEEFSISTAGLYSPAYFGQSVPQFAQELAAAVRADLRVLRPQLEDSSLAPLDYMTKRYIRAINAARDVVRRAADEVLDDFPDVIGFSITLDVQKMPAAAIARRLREKGFSGRLMAGGSAMDGRSPSAFLRTFTEFDAVLVGEADDSWVSCLDRIRTGRPELADIPGILCREGSAILVGPPETPPGDLDGCATPDYRDYIRQYESSEWSQDGGSVLVLESSRSCWWGVKSRCTFCAIDSEKRPYRTKSSDRAIAELREVYSTYRPRAVLYSDSIFPYSYRGDHLARLAEGSESDHWNLFYETKSTISRRAIARFACAGVREVQPGIESFSTRTLRLMRKGATALQQVNCLKWCSAYGVRADYGLIAGTPGETAEDLRQGLDVLRAIEHLDAPGQLNWLMLLQTSDYYEQLDLYGFNDVQPLEAERLAYRAPEPVLRDLVAMYRYTLPSHQDPEYIAAVRAIEEWIAVRRDHANAPSLISDDCGDCILVTRRAINGTQSLMVVADDAELFLLRECAEVRSLPGLIRSGPYDSDTLTAATGRLVEVGLLLVDGTRMLALPIPVDVEASIDAAWPVRITQPRRNEECHHDIVRDGLPPEGDADLLGDRSVQREVRALPRPVLTQADDDAHRR